MIPSSGCPPWPPDHPRTLPRTGNPTPPPGARPCKDPGGVVGPAARRRIWHLCAGLLTSIVISIFGAKLRCKSQLAAAGTIRMQTGRLLLGRSCRLLECRDGSLRLTLRLPESRSDQTRKLQVSDFLGGC